MPKKWPCPRQPLANPLKYKGPRHFGAGLFVGFVLRQLSEHSHGVFQIGFDRIQ